MEIPVGMGELRVVHSPCLLTAVGIGSCVAFALYDAVERIGGLAHTVLPSRRGIDQGPNMGRYIDWAVETMVNRMTCMGAKQNRITAKVFGGANMFPDIIDVHGPMDIGKRNIEAIEQDLGRYGIRIVAAEVGDAVGRSVVFDTRDGSVLVRTALQEQRRY